MKKSLRRRLERLEKLKALTRPETFPSVRYGWLKRLPQAPAMNRLSF